MKIVCILLASLAILYVAGRWMENLSCTDMSRWNEPITITLTTGQAAVLMGGLVGSIAAIVRLPRKH